MRVDTSRLQATGSDPDIAILVRPRNLNHILDGDKLTDERLPKVHTVLVGLQGRILGADACDIVGDAENATLVERGEELSGRGSGIFAENEGLDVVVRGDDLDIGGVGELSQVVVQVVGPGNTQLVC